MHEVGIKCTKYSRRTRKYDSSKELNSKKVYLYKDLATNQLLTWSIDQHSNLQFALRPLQ